MHFLKIGMLLLMHNLTFIAFKGGNELNDFMCCWVNYDMMSQAWIIILGLKSIKCKMKK